MKADLSWMSRRMCDESEAELFFPHPNDAAVEAKAICSDCPVALACLDYAVDTFQEHGVWGGLTEHERRRLLRRPQFGGLPAARCGTESGYRRHLRRGEPSCQECVSAARAARATREGKAS